MKTGAGIRSAFPSGVKVAGSILGMGFSADAISCDVAIVGAGLAGTALALSLDPRLSVAMFCKGASLGGASGWAQGGLAAVVAAEDSIGDHVADTLAAGAGLCDEQAVRSIVGQGADAVRWLAECGVRFDTRGDRLDLHREGGHGCRRIVHASDATGAAILDALAGRLQERASLSLYPETVAVDLVQGSRGVCGLYVLERGSGLVRTVAASRAVVLATGGAGKVYRYTTNPDDSTGDGIAMAWRAGCRAVNMEFVQFHPTALFHPQAKSVLISEAARGEGAVLVNRAGERFVGSFHPDGDLAPRDVVARAIDTEMKRSGEDCVFLDFRPMGGKAAQERFPGIAGRCARLGVDICAAPVPVVPSAHYLCGGIASDQSGVTDVNRLYVAGEVAHTGLHGANRLASNSLLECVVVARNAAARICDLSGQRQQPALWDASRVGPAHEEVMVAHNWDEIRRMMWNYVGIVRSDERLERARRRLAVIAEEVDEHYRRFVISSDFTELRNLLLAARLIVDAAAQRRESRGLHFNVDCRSQLPHASSTVLQRSRDDVRISETALAAN